MQAMSLRLARKLAISVLSLFVLTLVAELVARAAETGPLSLYDVSPYIKTATLPHVHRPNWRGAWDGSYYEINSRGWRGPELTATGAADELRIVAIGDSCTFGKAVEESECWPRQLETLLQAALGGSRRVLVANLGVNGYSGADYLEVFETQALPLEPHIVVLGYNINDFPNVVKEVDTEVFQGKQSLRSIIPYDYRDQLGKLALFRWGRARYYELRREKDLEQVESFARRISAESAASPEVLAEERARLERIVAQCDAIGAHVAMFLFPYESQVCLEQYTSGPIDDAHRVAEPLGIAFVDIVGTFRAEARTSTPMKRLFIAGDRYHPNADGYALVAREVRDTLLERGWCGPAR